MVLNVVVLKVALDPPYLTLFSNIYMAAMLITSCLSVREAGVSYITGRESNSLLWCRIFDLFCSFLKFTTTLNLCTSVHMDTLYDVDMDRLMGKNLL